MGWTRLRQVALVAHDLDAVVAELHEAFGLEVAFSDPAVATFGLRNAVIPIGTQFIEVVSPTRDGTAGGRQLQRLGGDGGYMVICHTDDHQRRRDPHQVGRRAEQARRHQPGLFGRALRAIPALPGQPPCRRGHGSGQH